MWKKEMQKERRREGIKRRQIGKQCEKIFLDVGRENDFEPEVSTGVRSIIAGLRGIKGVVVSQ